MKTTRRLAGFLSAMAILAITSSVTHGGGWATLTIANLPDYFVVGKPVPLTFLVRAHGVTLVDGMQTAVTAHLGTETEIQFASSPTGKAGCTALRSSSRTLRPDRSLPPVVTLASV